MSSSAPPVAASSSNGDVRASSPSGGNNGNAASATSTARPTKAQPYQALWDLDGPALDKWVKTVPAIHESQRFLVTAEVAAQVWKNLSAALNALIVKERPVEEEEAPDEEEEEAEPTYSNKRAKLDKGAMTEKKKSKVLYDILDPFNIFVHTIRKKDQDDEELGIDPSQEAALEIKTTVGGKFSQLTMSGILNGMAGVPEGLVVNKQCLPREGTAMKNETPVASAANCTFGNLKRLAGALYQAIQARVEADVLVTTPVRIAEMLAPDLQPQEFRAIRKRVHDTVILGKGMGHAINPENADVPTAASAGVHDIEKFKKCTL